MSSSCNDPTLFSPTIPAILANVSSSFSGSGEGGRNNPLCAARGAHRFRRQLDLYDGSAGWVRIQIKLQQLEENFGVEQGDRQAQGAVEVLSSLRSTGIPQ